MKVIYWIAKILIIIGALNWGLVGFFQYDLVSSIFGGSAAPITRIIFALVGISGLLSVACFISRCCGKSCGHCDKGCSCGSNCKCDSSCKCCSKKHQ